MNKQDGRKLSTKTQQKLRYVAINLCNKGNTFISTAKILNVDPSSVGNWWKLYKKEGYNGLLIKKRGVKAGTNSSINLEQTKILKKILINKTPDELKLNFTLSRIFHRKCSINGVFMIQYKQLSAEIEDILNIHFVGLIL